MTSLPNEKARSCLICSKTLLDKYAFSRHLKQTHEQGPFSCPDCNQIFDSGCKLHEHAGMKNHCTSKLPPFRHESRGILSIFSDFHYNIKDKHFGFFQCFTYNDRYIHTYIHTCLLTSSITSLIT